MIDNICKNQEKSGSREDWLQASCWPLQERDQFRGNFPCDVVIDFPKNINNIFLGGDPIRKRYIDNRVEIHFHIKIGIDGGERNPGYQCVAFHCALKNLHVPGVSTISLNQIVGMKHNATLQDSGEMQNSVLVRVSEFIENPERMGLEVFPALVRLQPLYDCLRCWADCADPVGFQVSEDICPHIGLTTKAFVPEDRELRLACDTLRQCAGVSNGESVDKMVESASEILDDITDDQRERISGDWIDTGFKQKIAGGIWIGFEDGCAVFGIDPILLESIQLIQVFMRPVNFQDMAMFWSAHNGYSILVDTKPS